VLSLARYLALRKLVDGVCRVDSGQGSAQLIPIYKCEDKKVGSVSPTKIIKFHWKFLVLYICHSRFSLPLNKLSSGILPVCLPFDY